MRSGIVASTVANAYRDTKRRSRPFEPREFMPEFDRVEEPSRQEWQEQLSIAEMLNKDFGGKDVRKKHRGDDSDADRQD